MNASILAHNIAEKIEEEFSVVIFSKFCDECDIDYVETEALQKVVEEVIISYCGKDLR